MNEIAVDSSSLIALLYGQAGEDTHLLRQHIQHQSVWLPPPVVSETLSYLNVTPQTMEYIAQLPLLPIEAGYWTRAGHMRRILQSKGKKSHLPDVLIAQSCIDYDIPLLTRDADFMPFAKYCGVKLALPLKAR